MVRPRRPPTTLFEAAALALVSFCVGVAVNVFSDRLGETPWFVAVALAGSVLLMVARLRLLPPSAPLISLGLYGLVALSAVGAAASLYLDEPWRSPLVVATGTLILGATLVRQTERHRLALLGWTGALAFGTWLIYWGARAFFLYSVWEGVPVIIGGASVACVYIAPLLGDLWLARVAAGVTGAAWVVVAVGEIADGNPWLGLAGLCGTLPILTSGLATRFKFVVPTLWLVLVAGSAIDAAVFPGEGRLWATLVWSIGGCLFFVWLTLPVASSLGLIGLITAAIGGVTVVVFAAASGDWLFVGAAAAATAYLGFTLSDLLAPIARRTTAFLRSLTKAAPSGKEIGENGKNDLKVDP